MSSWEMIGSPLIEFLKNNVTTDNKKITHQLLPGVVNGLDKYKYCILEEDYPTLIKLYHQHVYENKSHLSLMEKIGAVSPMFLDIDIKYCNDNSDISDKQYTAKTIELISKLVFKEIQKHVIMDDDSSIMGRCIVMEKPKTILKVEKNGDKIAKDGIHIIFPGIVIDRKLQQHIIKTLCLEENGNLTTDIFETLKTMPMESEQDLDYVNPLKFILDESIYKNGKMIMIGSRKPDNVPYEVTQVYDISTDSGELIYEDISIFDSYTLLELNSLYNCPGNKCEYFEDTDDLLSPKAPASKDDGKDTNSKKEKNKNEEFFLSSAETDILKQNNHLIPEDKQICEELAKLLHKDRADEYSSWINVGICLKNISNTHALLEIWKDFSKKSPKYNVASCDKIWHSEFKDTSYSGGTLGIGSLYYWAKNDNPSGYEHYINTLLKQYVDNAIKTRTQADVAYVVYKSAMTEFVCAGIQKQEWYFFNKKTTRWEYMDGAIMLRRYINNTITKLFNYYIQYYNDLSTMATNNGEPDQAELWDKKAGSCAKIFTALKTTAFKDNVVKEARDLYYDGDFLEGLDANTQLFGFDNCVFDLNSGMFRLGEPTDYVSLSCGISINLYKGDLFPISINDYYKRLKTASDYNELMFGLEDFLTKILPIPEVKEYTLRKLASCFVGDIREEKFHIWTGSGGNGKSKLIDLVEKVFGDYACKLPVALLTQKRGQSSGANPELARTQGKRFISMQEPNVDEKINIGLMKELTGGDKITARRLFKDCQDFKPQFTLFLMCNQLPDVPGDDDGTWRRLEVLEFISKFKEEVKPGDEANNIFKQDVKLTEKLDSWKFPFLLMLLDIYCNKYNKPDSEGGGIIVPHDVTKQTKKYRETNDLIAQFMEAEYEESSHTTKIIDIYKDFTIWYKECHDKKNIPKKTEFDEKIIKMQKEGSHGYSLPKNKTKFNFVVKPEEMSESEEEEE